MTSSAAGAQRMRNQNTQQVIFKSNYHSVFSIHLAGSLSEHDANQVLGHKIISYSDHVLVKEIKQNETKRPKKHGATRRILL